MGGILGLYKGLYRDNGKENGNNSTIGIIGGVYWDCEAVGLGFRNQGSKFRVLLFPPSQTKQE